MPPRLAIVSRGLVNSPELERYRQLQADDLAPSADYMWGAIIGAALWVLVFALSIWLFPWALRSPVRATPTQ